MAQLHVQAFGALNSQSPARPLIRDHPANDLLNVMDSLGEIMGWSGHGETDRPPLWELHEGELTPDHDDHCIGWINVSVNVDPPLVLPALIQCFHDALSRFSALDLTGIQVFGLGFDPRVDRFSTHPNWFNISPDERIRAIITFDEGLLGGSVDLQTAAAHLTDNPGNFRFGPLVDVPDEHLIRQESGQWPFNMSVSPYDKGLAATLPEWTPTAIGYALGQVTELAAKIDPTPEDFVVGITRLPPTPTP